MNSFDQKDYETAFSQFQEFADMSRIYFNVGITAMKLKDTNEAIDAMCRAIRCDSYFAAGYFQRGVLLYYSDDVEGALEDFQDCYEVKPLD